MGISPRFHGKNPWAMVSLSLEKGIYLGSKPMVTGFGDEIRGNYMGEGRIDGHSGNILGIVSLSISKF